MRKTYIILCLLLFAGLVRGQEINFSRVQDMAIWYNQSLKTDKNNSLKLNYRNVQYGGQIAYNSVAALFDMPLMSREARSKANARRDAGFFMVMLQSVVCGPSQCRQSSGRHRRDCDELQRGGDRLSIP